MQVTIELPEDIATHLDAAWKNLSRAALEALALAAYREQKLTTEQLRRMLGFDTRYQLDGFLKQRGVWLDYSIDDFEREGEVSARLWQRRQAEISSQADRERQSE